MTRVSDKVIAGDYRGKPVNKKHKSLVLSCF